MSFQDGVTQLDSAMKVANMIGWIYFLAAVACALFALCLRPKNVWIAMVPLALFSIPMLPEYFSEIAAMQSSFGGLLSLAASWAWSSPEYLGTSFFAVWPGVAGVMVLATVRIHGWKATNRENLLREGDRLAAAADRALGR